jgi:photosystem II stability/assembly factor-like uncharacterized protein
MHLTKQLLIIVLVLFTSGVSAQWSQQNIPGATGSFRTAYFKNTNEGYVAGGERIMRTTNGGASWDTISYGAGWAYLSFCIIEKIHFISPLEGIAAGWNFWDNCEIVFKTYDGGITWTSIKWGQGQAAFNTYLSDMFFLNSSVGICVGDHGHILRSTNGGENWNYVSSGTTKDLYGVYFVGNTGWIAGAEIILKTTDMGATWSSQNFPGEYFQDVYFTSISEGYAVGNHIYKTTDGGLTWNQIWNSSVNGKSVWAINADTIFIAGGGSLLKSNDAGQTWFPQYTSTIGDNYEFVWFMNSTFGLAGTYNGKVFKTTTGGDPVQANDAGVVSVSIPSNSCQGQLPVYARLKNYGQSNLTSATIEWKVNGISQIPYLWTGNLVFNDTTGVITLGSAIFNSGVNSIIAYTTMANGLPDYIHYNDTSKNTPNFYRLSGVKTIGGTNPDYTTISSAVTALNNNGTCGNVTFKIRNGTYTDVVTINNFFKTNANDQVIFESESGDSTMVVWNGNGIKINFNSKCSNVTIRKMSLSSSHAITSNAITVMLNDSVKNITISNCVLSSTGVCIRFLGDPCSDITISNNVFNNCIAGVEFLSSQAKWSTNVIINDNNFNGQTRKPIYIKRVTNLIIDKNIITTNTFNDFALTIESCDNGFTVSNNKILSNHGSILHVLNCNNSSGAVGKFTNNYFASVFNAPSYNANFITNSYNISFYNNSFNSEGNSVFWMYYNDAINNPNIKFINNAVVNRHNGYIFKIENQNSSVTPLWYAGIFSSISNNAYANNTLNKSGLYYFGSLQNYGNIYDFEEWQNIFETENSSVFADAQFVSLIDHHIYPNTSNYKLNNAGTPVPGVISDLDGEIRNVATPDIGADEFNVASLDAAALVLDKASQICAGLSSLSARIINYGTSTLTSAILNYSVNGVVQPPTAWNGLLIQGDSTSFHLLGSYNFITGYSYLIKVWTSSPNGGTDMVNVNDTITLTLIAKGLSGAYTIGGTSPNFATIADAVNAINTDGVCGPAIFNIRPGNYNETVTIANIPGTSPDNTVTFKSENGDSSSVIIYYTTTAPITVDSVSYLTFHQLTFGNGVNRGNIVLKNNSHHITFTNNAWDNANLHPAITNDVKNSSYIIVDRNYFYRCAGAVKFNSGYTVYSRGIVCSNNVVSLPTAEAFYIHKPYDLTIENNLITNQFTGGPNLPGMIVVNGGIGKVNILNNRIYVSNCFYGINFSYNVGKFFDKSIIANNMVSIKGNNSNTCFSTYNSRYVKFVFNTGMIDSTSSANNTVLDSKTNTTFETGRVEIFNNCFYNKAGGYAMKCFPNAPVSDYNNYFTIGPAHFDGTFLPKNLYGYQNATGNGLNSINVVPSFVSYTDLHLNNDYNLDNAGIPIPEITTDIDGNTRNPSTPDIGAHEIAIAPIANDAGVRSIIYSGYLCPGNSPVQVAIKNFGSNILTSATVHWTVNGIAQPDYAWSGSLTTTAISSAITIGNFNFAAPDSFIVIAWTSNPNGSTDNQPLNDTMIFSDFRTRLSGNYTIGGNNPDYIDITTALTALKNFGVCGPVTFNIRSGNYNQALVPVAYYGASSAQTVTFQSEANDSTQVSLGNVTLSGADYILIRGVTLAGVTMNSQSDYNVISNCIINNNVTITVSNYVLLDNNVVNGSISLNGTLSEHSNGSIIRNNIVNSAYGIYCLYQKNYLLENNKITNPNSFLSSGNYGIRTLGSGSSFKILKNRINGNFVYGMQLQQNGLPGDTALIANNIIVAGNLSNTNAYLSCAYANFVFNTSVVPSTSNSNAAQISSGPFNDGLKIMNNHFINYSNKYACYWAPITSNLDTYTNYNNYFTNGSTLINVGLSQLFPTIAAFHAAYPTLDANSTDFDPMFPSSSNLFPVNPLTLSTGTPIYGVYDDIDGNVRNSISPTIGAYEIPCNHSYSTISVSVCNSFSLPGSNNIWTTSGTYIDTITNAIGCDSIVTINLTILPTPVVTIIPTGTLMIHQGDSAIISATAGMTTYQWYRNSVIIPGATSMTYTAKTSGRYKCVAQNAALCSDTSGVVWIIIKSIPRALLETYRTNNKFETDNIFISPNPNNGIFELTSPSGKIHMFNSIGELIYTSDIISEKNYFNFSELPEGIYFIKLQTETFVHSAKVVLSR